MRESSRLRGEIANRSTVITSTRRVAENRSADVTESLNASHSRRNTGGSNPVALTILPTRSPSSSPAVGFFVEYLLFPLFVAVHEVLCQERFPVLVVSALPPWSSRSSKIAPPAVQ